MRPRILSVGINKDSPSAFDYGWKRLIACGCFSTIIILDPATGRCVQSLQGHRSIVSIVQWAPEDYYHDHKNSYNLRLASADANGVILIWDAMNSVVVSEFSEPGCSVVDLTWIQNQTVSRDLLLVLHSKGRCVLWNALTQMQLWKTNVNERFSSVLLDPYHSKHILLVGTNSLSQVRDFSLTSPFTIESDTLDFCHMANHDRRGGTYITIPTRNTDSISSVDKSTCIITEATSTSLPAHHPSFQCIQVCYHGYHKDCVVLVFKREMVIIALSVMQPVVTIRLDRGNASLSRVYSCRQRDVLICLHENGCLSVYAAQGLAGPIESSPFDRPDPSTSFTRTSGHSGVFSPYELVAQSEGARRPRQAAKLRFAVDRSRELGIAVVAVESRVHFWQLRQVPLQPVGESLCEPLWCLADLIPHKPGLVTPPKLCLQSCAVHMASKIDATVCRVCPQHFLKSIASRLGCYSLVAVGNCQGGVQIWDMRSGVLWREYQLLQVPVLGVEWTTLACDSERRDIDCDPLHAITPRATDKDQHHLGLIVHGWQLRDKMNITLTSTGPVEQPLDEDTKLEGRNYVILVNLATGYSHSFRPDLSDNLGDGRMRICGIGCVATLSRKPDGKSNASFEGPIDLARVSQLGQYLALMVRYEGVELWNMRSLRLIKRVTLETGVCGLALDWSQSIPKATEFASTLDLYQDVSTNHRRSAAASQSYDHASPGTLQRESFILCSSPCNLRLYLVNGFEVDSTAVPNTVLQGLPTITSERISAVAWFADLVAFGTADGFVAVRDLHKMRTKFRATSSFTWLNAVFDSASNMENSITDTGKSAVDALSSVNRFTTGVRRLCFIPGSSTCTRLLAVLFDSLYLWEPREMTLLCSVRFDGQFQRCLISADWAYPVTSPSDPALCLIIGGDGALRLVRVGGVGVEMIPATAVTSATTNPEQPTSRFFGSSPIPVPPHGCGPQYIPSVLPLKTALTIRHLLQHQPWHGLTPVRSLSSGAALLSTISESQEAKDDRTFEHSENAIELSRKAVSSAKLFKFACPTLASGFSRVQSTTHAFLQSLQQRPEFCRSFLSSSATIVERCLWTAQLFDDTYEIRFWRVVASRLLSTRPNTAPKYTLDLSWDWLSDHNLFRTAAHSHLQLLELTRVNASLQDQCIHHLILLGEHERAITLLLETSPDSKDYMVNMYRACLLASNIPCTASTSLQPTSEDTHLSTVKLIATNFLSCGLLNQGIQLLCLIGLYSDACRYLESFDQWKQSVWLAKCNLPPDAINGVLRRWATYLSSPRVNQKNFAVLIYTILDDHNTALKLLYDLNQYQLAARYLEACLQAEVIEWTEEHENMYCNIFLEFCKILINLGHFESAHYYCGLAGKLGESFRNEIGFLLA